MSTAPRPAPPRPAFAPLQSSANSSQTSSTCSSTSNLTVPSSAPPVPVQSPVMTAQPPQNFFASFGQQQQQHHQQQQSQQEEPQMPPMQRYRSFEYQPARDGAGRTAAETQNYLNQTALLAEAAKRAQMAVVMRDLDSMEL